MVEVGEPQPVSPHNQALYEAGKQMLVESVSVGREFCKFMVGVSTGAIPLYLALLQLALPKDYRPGWGKGIAAVVPAAGFLLAGAIFAMGVFPRSGKFSLDSVDAIDAARAKALRWRGLLSTIGFGIFLLAASAAVVVTVAALRVKAPVSKPKPNKVQIIDKRPLTIIVKRRSSSE
jgi:hypothetical protein